MIDPRPAGLRRGLVTGRAVVLKEVIDRIELPPFIEIPDAVIVAERDRVLLRENIPSGRDDP